MQHADGTPGVTGHPFPVVPKAVSLKADVVADDTDQLIELMTGPLGAVIGLAIVNDLISHHPAQLWL